MKVCRFAREGKERVGFYLDDFVLPLDVAARLYEEHTHKAVRAVGRASLLDCLPPDGAVHDAARVVASWLATNRSTAKKAGLAARTVQLLAPIARPSKILLLAGNYAAHIEEAH